MAHKSDEVMVSWVKLKGSNCPAYPVRTTVADIPIFLAQLDPGDAILVTRPLQQREGGERLRQRTRRDGFYGTSA